MTKKKQRNHIDKEFIIKLQTTYRKLREEKKTDWKRVLPFNEYVVDRWEKSKFVKGGKNSSIYDSSYIFGNVSIGNNTWIGPYTLLDGSGGKLSIGNYCSISSGVHIYTHNSVEWALTGGRKKYEKGPVKIGNNCYLGPYTIVTKDTKIGKCSLIGAHSLVNSDVPPFSIAFGLPAKVMGRIKIKEKKIEYEYFD